MPSPVPARKRLAHIRAPLHYGAEQVFDYLEAAGYPDHQLDLAVHRLNSGAGQS